MKRLLKLFPMLLLCVCALMACGGDDEGEEGKDEVYVIDGHKFVDLGLPSGLLWAQTNVGANYPEEPGYQYLWGETEVNNGKKYKFMTSTSDGFVLTKYNGVDVKTTLDPEDDVATSKWGKDCRMPTMKEMQELVNNCTWTDPADGKGVTVTGPNGNSIFLPLPAAKFMVPYWSSSLVTGSSDGWAAYAIQFFDSNSVSIDAGGCPRTITGYARPVARRQ